MRKYRLYMKLVRVDTFDDEVGSLDLDSTTLKNIEKLVAILIESAKDLEDKDESK